MKILFELNHPKDVNIFKNIILQLEKNGHIVNIIAKNKEIIFEKLDGLGFNYYKLGHYKGNLLKKAFGIPRVELDIFKIVKNLNPDVLFGSSMYLAHVGKILKKPVLIWNDTEGDFTIPLMMPFIEKIIVPNSYRRNHGPKEVRFDGYFELAYLHTDNFKPDPLILDELNLNKNEKYTLIRICELGAFHDTGAVGLNFKSSDEILQFVKILEDYGRVFISAELPLGKELEGYYPNISKNDFLSLIHYASLYIGDGASTAAEAAVLGVPSIYVTNTRKWGYVEDLEKYGLLKVYLDRDEALKAAIEILKNGPLRDSFRKKSKKSLDEKINPVGFFVELIESYSRD